jgi:hypothetical protein
MARDHYWASEMGCVAELIGTRDERQHYHDMPRTARGILFSLTFRHQEQPAEQPGGDNGPDHGNGYGRGGLGHRASSADSRFYSYL